MTISKDTPAGRTIAAAVYAAVVVLLAAGLLLGVWAAREMSDVATEQFNAQQMVIAQMVKGRIEREIGGVTFELSLLARTLHGLPPDSAEVKAALQQSLPRLLESGVRRLEVVDLATRRVFAATANGSWSAQTLADPGRYGEVRFKEEAAVGPPLWVSPVAATPAGADMSAAVPLNSDHSRLLAARLDVSALASGLLKDIRSGKSGYAWLIDQHGTFLYHLNPDFVGRDAFEVREERFPDVSFKRINFIQREKMLKGEQGTGWFHSGWHRGPTGQMKKLIAYCPVRIAENPPQIWAVAVVAPESEVKDALQRGHFRLILLQGVVIMAVVLGAGAIIWLENRWSRILEARVLAKTEALAKSEEKYRSLVESAEDFIFTVDCEGQFQSLNTFTANFFGGPPERFIGRPLSSALPGPEAERQSKLIAGVYRSGKSIREELELPGERSTWISANFMPVKTETGEVGTVLCIARDITETKNLQRQLVNAEKLASLGTLAAGVAHEINNPLGVILGFCELLLRKADPGSQLHEDLTTIERQGLLCKETVENLLSFARTEKQRGEQADLNACIEEIVKIVRHLLEKNGITLVLQLADPLPPVKADGRQLQQVFLNLTTNAMAAMAGGGTLTIRGTHDRSGRRVVVQFADTGSGIAPEHLDRIFEPFFTTKPEGQGTGLGLFVSYGIITGYGGTIECASTAASALGKQTGTTFTVKLPTGPREE